MQCRHCGNDLEAIQVPRFGAKLQHVSSAAGEECKRKQRNKARRQRDQIRRDCGLVRVRGALGGVYWE